MVEFFHHRFQAEHGVYDVANDGGVALRIEADISASDRAVMERDPYLKRLAIPPLDRPGQRQKIARDLERRGAIDFRVAAAAPIRENRVTDKFVDCTAALVHEVAGFAEPETEMLREIGAGNPFRHAAETANIANEQRDRPDRGIGASHGTGERRFEFRARKFLIDLLEDEIIFRNLNAGAVDERCWHYDPLIVNESAVAAAEIDNLILVAIVTTNERMLARDERASSQTDDVVARSPDGGGVADVELEWLAGERFDRQFGGHENNSQYLAAGRVRQDRLNPIAWRAPRAI